MKFRLVPKSVTLNNLEQRNGPLRYFIELGKPAFQHITTSARIELIDQQSASITHRAVKFACVTKCKDFSVAYFYFIVVSFALPLLLCFDAWLPVATKNVDLWRNACASLLYFVVRAPCCR